MYLSWIISNLLVAFAFLFYLIYLYFKWSYNYWHRRNVPYVKPRFPTGNLSKLFKHDLPSAVEIGHCYSAMKGLGHRYAGYYIMSTPHLLIIDTDLIKRVLVKDFDHFVNHGLYYNEKDDPLSAHLFSLEDDKWKSLRSKMTPTFTSGKMKTMFPILIQCSGPLKDKIASLVGDDLPLDIRDLVGCFTTDVIGSCAFGLDCNSFKDSSSNFRRYGKKALDVDHKRLPKIIFCLTYPNLAKKLGLKLVDEEVAAFFTSIVKETVDHRSYTKTTRKDFIQLLMELRKEGIINMDELSAQAFNFFVAGFETSSTALTFCFYELASNREVQDKLRDEIVELLEATDGEMTYESMADMRYMDQVINETLRKYPPFFELMRICTKPYQIPDSDVVIEKGTRVTVSPWALHHDPELFPKPDHFDPERFSEPNRHNIVPYSFLPFGDGPRVCIGMRFAIMQIKVALVSVLKNFRLHLHSSTPKKLEPLPGAFILTSKDTIYLTAEQL